MYNIHLPKLNRTYLTRHLPAEVSTLYNVIIFTVIHRSIHRVRTKFKAINTLVGYCNMRYRKYSARLYIGVVSTVITGT